MPLPYKNRFKLPLEYLSLQEWNNFVANLLFINQYGSYKLLQYYQNGSFKNLNNVYGKVLYVAQLKVNGYNVLHNLSEPSVYTFGNVFGELANKPSIELPEINIPIPQLNYNIISKIPNIEKQIEALLPNLISKTIIPENIAGTQFIFSGTTNLAQLTSQYLLSGYLKSWRSITLQNLGNNPIQINNSIYLMPKQCLKITVSNPQEVQITAQNPTLISELIEFGIIPITVYTITITNTQSDPTLNPFQQLLNLNLSNIISSPSQLLNLQFCLDSQCQTPLYAWIESYNSNLSNVYIWIKLPTSIPANSSITIYMFIRNSVQYPYTGINPTLTSTYAQYDNGENVFNFYDNFAGTTLNTNKWSVNGISYTVNNGFTATSSNCSGCGIWSANYSVSPPIIVEFYGNPYQSGYTWAETGLVLNSTSYNWGSFIQAYNGSVFGQQQNSSCSSNSGDLTTSNIGNVIWSIIAYSSSSTNYQVNYGNTKSVSSCAPTYPLYIGLIKSSSGSFSSSYFIQWIRVRAYPPNGIMPSNSNPQLTTIYVT